MAEAQRFSDAQMAKAIANFQEEEKKQAEFDRIKAARAKSLAEGPVSDRTRTRAGDDVTAGMKLMSEASRRQSFRVENKLHRPVKEFTDVVGGDPRLSVGRRGTFQAPQRGAPQQAAPAPQAPVQVVVQQPGAEGQPPPPVEAPVDATPPPASGLQVPAGVLGAAPGELPPQQPDEAALLETDAERQAAAEQGLDFDFSGEGDVVSSVEPEAPRNEGILQRQLNAEEQAATERVNLAQDEAAALQDASTAAQDALDEATNAQEEHDARLDEKVKASEQATAVVADLTKQAQEQAAIDPKRAWANAGIGRKVGFALQMALSSFGGRSPEAVWAPMRKFIDDDIETQIQQTSKLGRDIGQARGVATDQANLLSQTRAQLGDEQAAQDTVWVAKAQQLKADLTARMAASGIPLVGSEQELLLTRIEEDIAAKNMAIQARAATNPQAFTRSVAVHSAAEREGMRVLGKGLIEGGIAGQERADVQEGKLELQGQKFEFDALENQRAEAAKSGDKVAADAFAFGKETASAQQVIELGNKILKQDDIAGFGFTSGPAITGAAKDTDADLDLFIEAFGRKQSGGVIGPDEEERFRAMALEGTTFGGESRLRRNIERMVAMSQISVDAVERALSPEARQYYDRNVNPAEFEARFTGGGGESVVVED